MDGCVTASTETDTIGLVGSLAARRYPAPCVGEGSCVVGAWCDDGLAVDD